MLDEIKQDTISKTPVTQNVLNQGYFAQNMEIKPFKDEFEKMLEGVNISFVPEINPLMNFEYSDDLSDTFSYDTNTIPNQDAMFFLNIASQGENLNIQMNDELSVIDARNYKTMEVSKTLGDMLIRASENNKSLRLDFDNQVTVVLKIAKDGKIDASFFPQNKEVENYLKHNIDYLKVRFDDQAIAYSNISYKPYREKREEKRQQQQGDK